MTKFDQFKQKLTQNRKILLPVAIVAILVGGVLLWFGLIRTITVIVDGVPVTVRTPALSVNGVLRAAEVPRDPANRRPARPGPIDLERAACDRADGSRGDPGDEGI